MEDLSEPVCDTAMAPAQPKGPLAPDIRPYKQATDVGASQTPEARVF
jgi:hypothetical protein